MTTLLRARALLLLFGGLCLGAVFLNSQALHRPKPVYPDGRTQESDDPLGVLAKDEEEPEDVLSIDDPQGDDDTLVDDQPKDEEELEDVLPKSGDDQPKDEEAPEDVLPKSGDDQPGEEDPVDDKPKGEEELEEVLPKSGDDQPKEVDPQGDGDIMNQEKERESNTVGQHFWTYLVGNLRSFPKYTGEMWRKLVEEFSVSEQQTNIVALQTWATLEHTQVTWWKGSSEAQPSSTESVSYLESDRNPLRDYKYFTYRVEDWEVSKDLVQKPSNLNDKMILAPIICSNFYTLGRVHQLAMQDAERRGIIMEDSDVILKARPDVECFQLFNVTAMKEYFKENPYVIFSASHEQQHWWQQDFVSDVVYILSKAAMDKMVSVNFSSWFEAQITARNIYFERALPPEWVLREYFHHLGFRIRFAPSNWTCQVKRMDGRTLLYGQTPYNDYKVVDLTTTAYPPHVI